MLHIGSLYVDVEEWRKGPEVVLAVGYKGKVLSRSTVGEVRRFAEDLMALCDDVGMQYQLKPCPFCGSTAAIDWRGPSIRCTSCSAWRSESDGLEETVRQWNRRA